MQSGSASPAQTSPEVEWPCSQFLAQYRTTLEVIAKSPHKHCFDSPEKGYKRKTTTGGEMKLETLEVYKKKKVLCFSFRGLKQICHMPLEQENAV